MAPGPSAETVSAIQDRLNGDVNSDGEIVQRRNVNKKKNAVSDNHNHEEVSYADAVKKGTDHDGDDKLQESEKLDFDVELPSSHVMKLHPVCQDPDTTIYKPHLPRANLAVSKECPFGTQTNNWAKQHRNYSTMQQHCLFFDPDNDGVIWPSDTFRGLWQLGYPVVVIVWATVIIHAGFSWFSSDNWLLPDPFFRLTLKNVHRSKHGSDTHVFDQEGRFHPALFENIFTKYDREKKGGLTFMDGMRMLYGNRVVADFAGYLAGFVEWVLTYLLVAKDGVVYKDDLRKVYDGSIFFEIAGRKDGHY